MNREEITYLGSDDGKRLLDAIREMEGDSLRKQERLRKTYPVEMVRAGMLLSELRERASAKFEDADRMFFDRDGLEQASGDVIAQYRAKRFSEFDTVADLCCGVGGDTAALAEKADVTAVDLRPERVRMTRANLAARGLRARVATADVRRWCPTADAYFVDPSRREQGRRVTKLSEYAPSVDDLSWMPKNPTVGIKVAPGIDHESAPDGCEMEFISVDGACREAVLWLGGLRNVEGARTTRARTTRVRATLLPGGHSLVGTETKPVPCGEIARYVYEPDRSVIRAHLVDQVAESIGASKLAPDVAYLTSDERTDSPFVKGYEVADVVPFSLKRIQSYLTERLIGRIEIKKRRFPMTPDEVYSRLKLVGEERVTLILTRLSGDPVGVFCQPVKAP